MRQCPIRALVIALLAASCSGCAQAAPADGQPFTVTRVADLDSPWAMTFLPDGRMLVTEKAGKLMLGSADGGMGGPDFEYTRLNAIKPALIAEATANARKSAEQFAKDSGAHIGGIRSANQGVVDISDRDQGSPQVKKVRVVTTVEYFLTD